MSLNPEHNLSNVEHILGDPDNCNLYGSSRFWIPVVQGNPIEGKTGQYQWLDDRPGYNHSEMLFQKWTASQPNGFLYQKCVETHHDAWNDLECESVKRCSVCIIPKVQKYLLRGPVGHFDQEYSLSFNMQLSTTRIVFEGQGLSRIIWYPLQRQTKLVNRKLNLTRIFDQNPFGLLGYHENILNRGYEDELVFTNVCIERICNFRLTKLMRLSLPTV